MPSIGQSAKPSPEPSSEPSVGPSAKPSPGPYSEPSLAPSDNPSLSPSSAPLKMPSIPPSISISPTDGPTKEASELPTAAPSDSPATSPSLTPQLPLDDFLHLFDHVKYPSSSPTNEPDFKFVQYQGKQPLLDTEFQSIQFPTKPPITDLPTHSPTAMTKEPSSSPVVQKTPYIPMRANGAPSQQSGPGEGDENPPPEDALESDSSESSAPTAGENIPQVLEWGNAKLKPDSISDARENLDTDPIRKNDARVANRTENNETNIAPSGTPTEKEKVVKTQEASSGTGMSMLFAMLVPIYLAFIWSN